MWENERHEVENLPSNYRATVEYNHHGADYPYIAKITSDYLQFSALSSYKYFKSVEQAKRWVSYKLRYFYFVLEKGERLKWILK